MWTYCILLPWNVWMLCYCGTGTDEKVLTLEGNNINTWKKTKQKFFHLTTFFSCLICYSRVIPTNVETWIILAFSVIAESRHSDGVQISSHYWKITEWCHISWQCLTATVPFTRCTAEFVVSYWEVWWSRLWCLKYNHEIRDQDDENCKV